VVAEALNHLPLVCRAAFTLIKNCKPLLDMRNSNSLRQVMGVRAGAWPLFAAVVAKKRHWYGQ
jgi:hypothetical protein